MFPVLLKKAFLGAPQGWDIVDGKAEVTPFLRLNFFGRPVNTPVLNEPLKQFRFFRRDEKNLSITVSIGLSSYHDDDNETVNSLIYNADRAMYEAKNAGRNKSISFQESATSDTNK